MTGSRDDSLFQHLGSVSKAALNTRTSLSLIYFVTLISSFFQWNLGSFAFETSQWALRKIIHLTPNSFWR